MPLKLVFMGTPDFSVPALEAIVAAGHEVVAVYSQPPRPAGRGMAERPSPVHAKAAALGIPVRTPRTLKAPEDQAAFADLGADAAVVIAYGLLLPRAVLDATKLGCFNVHASELPRWRGAAPIQRAIMAGDERTAVMVMRMEEGLDTGPVALTDLVPITPNTTAGELHDTLSEHGARLIVEALAKLEHGPLETVPQPADGITYAAKIDKKESQIDFAKPAREVHNHIRGLSPFPGAWFEATPQGGKPERIKVLRSEIAKGQGAPGELIDNKLAIACGEGAIRLVEVQRAGKRAMSAEEFQRGFALPRGTRI
ncbi:methionyl-tRNA formyltransferase [Hyphomicrobium sp. LHD-15]|uniref:methionyl-tRNA formyltransferase n=1 Tax=Hyphomicrobium sp. LHD-15 TaxID=3072142 RepID=UPI00280E50CC|nr:methionyl-tRNA formyltransferase [Hyphomicrobium sp. LHD-15]MDQ8698974.1 methionyl-tRNA formyltransferase [Hyphomicrobium sp. LHD-15]